MFVNLQACLVLCVACLLTAESFLNESCSVVICANTLIFLLRRVSLTMTLSGGLKGCVIVYGFTGSISPETFTAAAFENIVRNVGDKYDSTDIAATAIGS